MTWSSGRPGSIFLFALLTFQVAGADPVNSQATKDFPAGAPMLPLLDYSEFILFASRLPPFSPAPG